MEGIGAEAGVGAGQELLVIFILTTRVNCN